MLKANSDTETKKIYSCASSVLKGLLKEGALSVCDLHGSMYTRDVQILIKKAE